MSYYKITYESNTIEGLKAVQGSFPGHGTSSTDSTSLETQVPPPPPQQEKENVDAFSGVVQAPPTPDGTGASLDFSNENAFYPPPPRMADLAIMDDGLGNEIPPPPKELNDQEGNETQPHEGDVPPPDSASKNPKESRKSSK